MPLGDGAKFAGYTIERQLGAGGMGEVYLARHPRLPRHDAIKVLRPAISSDADFIERFNREADLASKLWHPHIVGILDRGKYRGRLWISMDFVDGTDASRLLQRYPNGVPADEALAIVKAVASALDYSHSRGLLHRDVKPANILLADSEHGERRILLGDFGVARDLADNTSGGLTATNMTVGTAAYASPEQLMGLQLDGRSDQYSLAATTYHLLTGNQLFQESNPAVVIGKHLNAAPPRLGRPELAGMDAALVRALAKDPGERFATCLDFATALETPPVPADESVTTPSIHTAHTRLAPVSEPVAHEYIPSSGRSSGRPVAIAAGAAVVIVVTALVACFALQPAQGPPPGEPFTLAGKLQLAGSDVKTSGLPAGYTCAGAKELRDISPDAPITVEDETGKLLAKGTMAGSTSSDDGCVMRFKVGDVPSGARFYRVQVGDGHEKNYTEAEARSGVDLLMGASDDPTTTRAQPTMTPTRTVIVTPAPDMEKVSLTRLQNIADGDRSDVATYYADRWIPQISSKRVGIVARGITWDNQSILEEHLRLRSIYPDVRLLWSGDWSTYDGRDFWVTVVGKWSYDPNDILSWCSEQGFDRDNCIAKIVSTTHSIDGSTKLNP